MVYFLVVIMIISVGLGLISYNTASNALEANVRDSLPELATQVAAIVDRGIQANLNTIEGIAYRDVIRSMNWDRQIGALTNETQRNGYRFMGVATPDGHIKLSTGNES